MGSVIHGYLCNGNTDQIARQVNNLPTIESVEVHISNSDLIANVLYTDNKQLLKTSSDIKKIEDVERIVWS